MLQRLLHVLSLSAVALCFMCPDGHRRCGDQNNRGYGCCPHPQGVCCGDRAHCCPSGFQCNAVTHTCDRSWESTPMLSLQPPPALSSPTVVYCDNYFTCPTGYTCCRHPKGGWTCCPYSPARCCLDGYHCCPYGFDCDYTYTHCIRQGVPHPFSPPTLEPVPAQKTLEPPVGGETLRVQEPAVGGETLRVQEPAVGGETLRVQEPPVGGVIRCDSSFYCSKGSTCCKGSGGQWSCCPFPLATCCADGIHCCEFGYTCDPGSKVCRSKTSTP